MSYKVPKEVPSSEAREHFIDIVNAAAFQHKRVVLKRSGKQMCAIIPIEDYYLLEEIEDSLDLQEALKILEENKGKERISLEEMKDSFGI